MPDKQPSVSDAWMAFTREAPKHAEAWMQAAEALAAASALDAKTRELAYLAVLAALRVISGVPFHAALAKKAGATRDEVISAILVGLAAAGGGVTAALPPALEGYETA